MLRSLATTLVLLITSPAMATQSWLADFSAPHPGSSLLDSAGVSTGLTHRLPGTGASIAANDPNLALNLGAGTLDIQSQHGDPSADQNLAGLDMPGWYIDGRPDRYEEFYASGEFVELVPQTPGAKMGVYLGSDVDNVFLIGLRATDEGTFESFAQIIENGIATDLQLPRVLTYQPGDTAPFIVGRGFLTNNNSMFIALLPANNSGTTGSGIAQLFPAFYGSPLYAGVFNFDSSGASAGNAHLNELNVHAVPIPEPSTYLLGIVALTGLLAFQRRSR